MSNQLENFINNNRDEFDSKELSKGSWVILQSKLDKKNKATQFKIKRMWWAAAASIIVIASGIIYFTALKSKTNEAVAIKTIALPPKELVDAVDTTITDQLYSFAYIIHIKQDELKKNQKKNPGLYHQFLKDNDQLDSSYNYLKSELAANPNKEILLEAMIQSLQLKIELLTRQLQIIQQSKTKKFNNEDKSI